MKRLMTALLATVAGSALAEYRWINPDTNTADAPFEFSQSSYWDANGVPVSSTSALVTFTNSVGSGYRFVTIPDDFTFNKIIGNNASPVVLIGSSVHSVYGFDHVSGNNPAVYLYATSDLKSALYLNRTQICGDIIPNMKSVFEAAGDGYHRLDLYANEAGGVRRNPSTTYAIGMGYGTFHIFAPHGTDADITANWRLTNGSAIAFRSSGQAEHTLASGTIVTAADGILPEGTFLKRIFPDGSIELSNPATLPETSADTALTFAAMTADVEQDLWQLNYVATASVVNFDVSKWRDADRFVYRIRSLTWQCKDTDPLGETKKLMFTSETGIPGCIETTDVYEHQTALVLDNCHLQFENPRGYETGRVPGFRDTRKVSMSGTSAKALVTVTNGITAYFGGLTKIVGTFRKNGAGRLIATFGNAQTAGSASDNAGSIAVEEGTMDFACADGSGVVGVANLSVGKTATIQLPADSVLKVTGTFAAAAGATVSGPGAIVLPSGLGGLLGVNFTNGAAVRVIQNNAGLPVYEQPKGLGPAGTPVFWADAGQGVSADEAGNVTRWNDCRGEGYMYATNVASVYPLLKEDHLGHKYLHLIRNADAVKTDVANTAALVWNVPLSNIRAVFAVVDLKDGGGVVLGSSPRVTTHDYWRNGAWYYWNQVMGGSCSTKVSQGKIYTNGESIPAFNVGFPYAGYDFTASNYKKGLISRPLLITMQPTGDTEADCFGFCNYEDGCNGNCRIYEYVIYTNALTTAERLETEEYLMMKWMAAHANYQRLGEVTDRIASLDVDGVPPIDVADGDLVAVDAVSGAGSLVKGGKGTLYVEDLVSDQTSVEVREGTLNLRSVRTTADTLPVSPVVHFDASDASTLTAATNDGVVTITEMRDRRGDAYAKAIMALGTSLQLNEIAEVGGRTMADFGPYLTGKQGKSMKFWKDGALFGSESLRTTISVIGTAQGGGFLAGETSASKSLHDLGGIHRDATSYGNPIVGSVLNRPLATRSGNTSANRTRLNGAFVNPTAVGFTGGYDMISMVIYENFGSDGICACEYGSNAGGQEFGEQMLFDEALSREQVLAVEAYLNRKWFGKETQAYRGSLASALKVDAGATVNVYGDAPFEVSSLSGAGVVNGAVRLASKSGELVVGVGDDGNVSVPACSGLDLSTGGVIRFEGALTALKTGRTVLIENVTAPEGALTGWTVVNPSDRRIIAVRVVDGDLVADVTRNGFHIFVR